MSALEKIRHEIERLYGIGARIHINISMTHPKLVVHNVVAEIKEVYPNIFINEERDCGFPRRHSLSYTDVLIKQVEILELRLGTESF